MVRITLPVGCVFPLVLVSAVLFAACQGEPEPGPLGSVAQQIETSVAPPAAYFNGGTGAVGVHAEGYWGLYGKGTVGQGVVGKGGPASEGGFFEAGTAATPETRRAAVTLVNGDLRFESVAAPAPTTPVVNVVTPLSVAKAWAKVVITKRGGGVSLRSGVNVAAVGGHQQFPELYTVYFAAPFATVDSYACQIQSDNGNAAYPYDGFTAWPSEGEFPFLIAWTNSISHAMTVTITCFGAQ